MNKKPTSNLRVRLLPVVADDLPTLFEFQCDPASNRMAAVHPRSRDEFDAHWSRILGDSDVIAQSIRFDDEVNDEVVGCINCFQTDGQHFVGYWIGRAYWNRGIATSALEQLLVKAQNRPLYAHVAVSNLASIRVLQKCGFEIVDYQHSPGTDRLAECEEAVLRLA